MVKEFSGLNFSICLFKYKAPAFLWVVDLSLCRWMSLWIKP